MAKFSWSHIIFGLICIAKIINCATPRFDNGRPLPAFRHRLLNALQFDYNRIKADPEFQSTYMIKFHMDRARRVQPDGSLSSLQWVPFEKANDPALRYTYSMTVVDYKYWTSKVKKICTVVFASSQTDSSTYYTRAPIGGQRTVVPRSEAFTPSMLKNFDIVDVIRFVHRSLGSRLPSNVLVDAKFILEVARISTHSWAPPDDHRLAYFLGVPKGTICVVPVDDSEGARIAFVPNDGVNGPADQINTWAW